MAECVLCGKKLGFGDWRKKIKVGITEISICEPCHYKFNDASKDKERLK